MAEALNTCTLSVQCPPEHLHVLSASVQGTGTSYSGAGQGVFLCYKNRFVLQKPFCATKRLAPGVASAAVRLQSRHLILYEKPEPHESTEENTRSPPEMGRPHQSRPEAKGDDEREVKGESLFVHTKFGQTRGTFIPSVCPITVRLHAAFTR